MVIEAQSLKGKGFLGFKKSREEIFPGREYPLSNPAKLGTVVEFVTKDSIDLREKTGDHHLEFNIKFLRKNKINKERLIILMPDKKLYRLKWRKNA
jgi:hypothetical protein